MDCSVCGNEFVNTFRFCRTCANDSTTPIGPNVSGIASLSKAYQALSTKPIDWNGAEAALQEALLWSAVGHWPPPLLLRARIEYAFIVLRRAGCEPSDLPQSDLELFAERLDGTDWTYDNQLTDEWRADLERGSGYGQLIRGHLSLCEKLLSLPETERLALTKRRGTGPVAPTRAASQPVQPREGEANGDNYTLASPYGAERLEVASTGIRCARCRNHVIPLSACQNCGGVAFILGTDPLLKATGLFCLNCRNGFTSVTCVCGCRNPIDAGTIMRLKAKSSGCFIASAACGDPFAPEVIVLSAFRDNWLSNCIIGRAFIGLYYAVSPTIATMIVRSTTLRQVVMATIVRPSVWLVQRLDRSR